MVEIIIRKSHEYEEQFDSNRIIRALMLAANNTGQSLTPQEIEKITEYINRHIPDTVADIEELHLLAIDAANTIRPDIATAYNAYHLYH